MDTQVRRTEDSTLTSIVAERLRREIISGAYAPGEKLKVRDVAKRLEVGISPVREALNRLTSDRIVVFSDHKGFAVADIGLDHLEDLVLARCWVNEKALRESIARGGQEWEDELVLAHHHLVKATQERDTSHSTEWELAHRRFHRALVSACGSSWIVDACDRLFDVADLYRSVARTAPGYSREGRDKEHDRIMESALARSVDDAVELLMQHFQRTAESCKIAIQHKEATSTKSKRVRRTVPASAAI